MKIQDSDDIFVEKARKVLLASVTALDDSVLARLRDARRLAVVAAERPQAFWRVHRWSVPAGALAALFVVVVGTASWWNNQDTTSAAMSLASNGDELPGSLGNESVDLYADMDFYRWMETQDQAPKPAPADEDNSDDEDTGDATGEGG
jgi:hypothetical protein